MSDAPDSVPDVTPDLPGLPWRATLALISRLPQAALSRGLGRIADTPLPRPMRGAVIGTFARLVGIDASEAELAPAEYPSLNAFFVRRLKPGARSWPDEADVAGSPVDGIIGRHGTVHAGRLIQAKGRDYSAAALLDSEDEAARYESGSFLTIYLSPRHYHRIHAPCGGAIPFARHVPGALLPVNEPAVRHVPDLFPRNERVVCPIDGPIGRVTVVAVGAYNVGRISTTFDAAWVGAGVSVANRAGAVAASRVYEPPRTVAMGAEIMAFHLGSTVVLLFERGTRIIAGPPGSEVRLGAPVARRV